MKQHKLFLQIACVFVVLVMLVSWLPAYAIDEDADIETETTGTETFAESSPTEATASDPTEDSVCTEAETDVPAPHDFMPVSLSVVVGEYRVAVLCGSDAELPDDTELVVSLLSNDDYASYVSDSAAAAGISDDEDFSAHVLDISLVDPETGEELSPAAPVQVCINLLATQLDNEVSVVHVAYDQEMDASSFDVLESSSDEDSVEFETDSFSVFVIIDGPSPVSNDLVTAQDLSELPGDGFFLSIKKNNKTYYFKGEINAKNCIARTNDGDYESAAVWYFEPTGNADEYYLYTLRSGARKYIKVLSTTYIELSETEKTAFTVSQFTAGTPGSFYVKVSGTASTGLNYSGSNDSFKCYTQKNDDCKVVLTYPPSIEDDAYGLDRKRYGVIYYDGTSVNANALIGEAGSAAGCLAAETVPVRENPLDDDETLLVPEDGSIDVWTFHSVGEDFYTISVGSEASAQYVALNGTTLSMTDEAGATAFQFIPGTGSQSGRFKLLHEGVALSYDRTKKQFVGSSAGTARDWLSLAALSGLSSDDFVNYTAQKVSVSDTDSLYNGAHVIVYTRIWNESEKRYDFYAIDHDGRLLHCYEHGDTIQWVGTRINTALWDFTEYYYEGTNVPNYYYELRNEYSGKFIAPQIGGASILSDDVIGLTMNGRKNGEYYTPILAWDDSYYAYAAMKTDSGYVSSGYLAEAEDFYFAIVLHDDEIDQLQTVATLDNNDYGITMKLVNFGNRPEDIITATGEIVDNQGRVISSSNPTSQDQYDVIGGSVYDPYRPTQGLLSTELSSNGYPVATETGRNLVDLFGNAEVVNHLFDASIYSGSGYYEFNSTQNFASLTETGDFVVYKGIGTVDSSSKNSLKHGQFLPYNDISAEYMASVNPENLYDATLVELPNDDPRKHERLFLVRQPDYFFGMEIEASFVQTPNGRDKWGHDIIYEFTGDDDFWLYVDGELVIDLGGVHSAYPGSVNFCTGQVSVNGVTTTLKEVFRRNYADRLGLSGDDPAVEAYLDGLFELNDLGQYVFKDYSVHTMKIFFMERGASASNLHTRFNLSAVKEGQVLLSKELSGVQSDDYYMSEYPFQIYYSLPGENENDPPVFMLLEDRLDGKETVTPVNSSVPIDYVAAYSPPGSSLEYHNVFFLSAGETAAITLPDDTIEYYVVECGVNTEIYDAVSVNEVPIAGTATSDELRRDYSIPSETMANRPQVIYNNHISENAVRTLTITKRIFAADGTTPLSDPDSTFNFRLYLAAGEGEAFAPANMKAYCVKDPSGNYCVWDVDVQAFSPTSYSNWDLMPDAVKTLTTFYTSPNGAISKVPAEYHVEVRGLVVGTKFRVEERDYEIPAGYTFLRYERDANSYIVESGDTVNSGIIRAGQSPAIEVHNKQVWDLTVYKVWSDAPYMDEHDDIFFAVYVNGTILPGTVRVLQHPSTSLLYRFDQLAPGASFSSYAVREVSVSGDYAVDADGYLSGSYSVSPIGSGESLSVLATAHGEAEAFYEYSVAYSMGTASGVVNNVRADTVSNTRQGLRIVKEDMTGNPAPGAVFLISDSSGATVGGSAFVSGSDGLVTTAYLSSDETYTILELSAPSGYQAMDAPVVFTFSASGIAVLEGPEGGYSVDNTGEPCLVLKNKTMSFRAVKVDRNGNAPLAGAVFDLYAEVTVDGTTRMDYRPLSGYTDLTTSASGVIPGIDHWLPAGAYYLVETASPAGFDPIEEPIRFVVSGTGYVSLDEHEDATLSETDAETGCEYCLYVYNGESAPEQPDDIFFDLPMTGGKGIGKSPAVAFVLQTIFISVMLFFKKKRQERP